MEKLIIVISIIVIGFTNCSEKKISKDDSKELEELYNEMYDELEELAIYKYKGDEKKIANEINNQFDCYVSYLQLSVQIEPEKRNNAIDKGFIGEDELSDYCLRLKYIEN